MERWLGRVAIVTGASEGIGAGIAKRLVKHGMKVVGCSRNIKGIEDLAASLSAEKGSLHAIPCDISKESDIVSLVSQTRQQLGGADVCINNAGISVQSTFLEGDYQTWRYMTDVNILGVATATREVIKDMRDRGINDGHIININSLGGHRVSGTSGPMLNFYRMTKYALTAMTECTRGELRHCNCNIRISQVSPGVTKTGIFKKIFDTEDQAEQYLAKRPYLSVDDVVDAVIYQLAAPANVQVHDMLIRPNEEVN